MDQNKKFKPIYDESIEDLQKKIKGYKLIMQNKINTLKELV